MESRDSGLRIRGSRFCTAHGLAFLLTFASLSFAGTQSGAEVRPGLIITVRVYNYAAVSRGTLVQAEEEASRIFREAEVEMAWVDCPVSHADEQNYPACPQVLGPAGVDLRIIPATMALRLSLPKETLGHALPSRNSGGASASWVFYHRVKKLAQGKDASEAQLLGHAMAHEIGHLLLGPNQHSSEGIMRADWGREDLKRAAWGMLRLTPQQSKRIRAEVMSRVQAGRTAIDSARVAGN